MPQNHPTTDTTTLEAESAATETSAAPQAKPRRARKKAAAVPAPADLGVTTADEPAVPKTPRRTRKAASKQTADPAPEPVGSPTVPSAASLLFQAPEFVAVEPVEPVADPATVPAPAGEPGDDETPRRRRRRGGRGRRKKGAGEPGEAAEPAGDDDTGQPTSQPAVETPSSAATGQDDTGAADAAAGKDEVDDDAADGEETAAASRRRRRRRRRKGEPDTTELAPDDPADTVVRIREPRPNNADEVTSLKGSTRLEAKKQRRREGREAGRRRPPVISEAEFLARREAVDRVMVVRQTGDRIQIGVLEDGVLVEHYVSRSTQQSMVGNVYLGRVQNVLPAMEAAFVDIGRGRNAIIYAGEVDWAGLGKPDGPRRIEEVLKSGQSVLVQVTKDPVGHKGARLTGQISLAGRYVVYVPAGSMSGISRKLPENERARLKKILQQVVPDDSAVIVRTAAEGASEEELTHDVARLRAQWDDIAKKSSGNAPQLLYSEPDLAIKVVRDLFNEDFAKLVVSGDEAWDTIEAYVSYVASSLRDRLERWSGDGDVFAAYRIDEQIAKALERKVWLPSGGSLVIDRTEAMTVVDVNTGKFTGSGGNLEETVTKNNLEAAEEVVRQLRLRDIGGIIVIDFIDMVLEANRDLVLRRLVECLGRDRTKHQVAEVTSLGLVQMTRKRIGTDLLEAFSEPCEQCNGRGLHIHLEPVEPTAKPAEVGGDGAGRSGRGRRVARAAAEPVAAEEEGVTEEMTPEPGLISAVEVDEFDDLEPLSADDVPSGDGSAEPVVEATTVPVPETPPASAPAPRRSRRRAVRPAGEPDAPAEPAVREEIDADAEPATV